MPGALARIRRVPGLGLFGPGPLSLNAKFGRESERDRKGRAAVTDRSTDEERAARQRTAQRQGLAYQGAFEAVIAILIAAGIGLWADQYFDTSPRYLLIGTVVGFTSFVLRLVRLGRQIHPDASEESEQDEQR